MIIGLIHGLTNSGGTLLTIFLLSLNKNLKKDTRQDITFFYLFLASYKSIYSEVKHFESLNIFPLLFIQRIEFGPVALWTGQVTLGGGLYV